MILNLTIEHVGSFGNQEDLSWLMFSSPLFAVDTIDRPLQLGIDDDDDDDDDNNEEEGEEEEKDLDDEDDDGSVVTSKCF